MSMNGQRERIARWERLEEILRATQAPQPVNWKPKPGPQTDGYHCLADILFFGGAAGTGKTQLLLGLAGTQGRKSIIFRRTFQALLDIETRAVALYGHREYHRQRRIFELRGRTIELGAVANFGDEHNYDSEGRKDPEGTWANAFRG
jgi:hypothetical protein